ncbi:MAG: Holliday junction branch migration protein RuvA [Planctomycetota bacterium]|jgi:Holliday junction DNA helicase RuvA
MFDHLRGRLVEHGSDEVVLDIGGVAYRLAVSGATSGRLPAGADEVTVYVHDMIKDDRILLYGFASREERSLFLRLLTVSRIGPGIALSMLSALEPEALATAVEAGDVAVLARVRGVGRRTAERLCVDLKGRLEGFDTLPGRVTDRHAAVTSALVALGYPRATARATAERVCGAAGAETELEQLVRNGLRELSSATATADPPA